MRSLKTCAAIVAVLAMSTVAQAARTSSRLCGASKCCECAPTSQALCCKPTIPRPCCTNVHTYQRQASCLKPPCCDSGCGPKRCCRPNRRGCGNGACCNNGGCGNGCNSNGACSNNACGNGNGCGNDRRGRRACGDVCGSANCCHVDDPGCQAPCGTTCPTNNSCDNGNACAIAQMIYQSQTGCYSRSRRAALRRLAKFDCTCNPEIMSAFVYALNDAVETVRSTAAAAIGDQVRRNPCCCSPCIINALTNALGDCDRLVRREAEKALCACGYEVVTPTCEAGCDVQACSAGSVPAYSPATAPQPAGNPEVAPPPAEPKAYRQQGNANTQTVSTKRNFRNLFGLLQ